MVSKAGALAGPAFIDVVTELLVSDLPPVYSSLKTAGRDPLMRPIILSISALSAVLLLVRSLV